MNIIKTEDVDYYLLFSKELPPKTGLIEYSEKIDVGYQSVVLPRNLRYACYFMENNKITPIEPYVMTIVKKEKETLQ